MTRNAGNGQSQKEKMAKILKNINRERQVNREASLDPRLTIANTQHLRGDDRKLKRDMRNQVKTGLGAGKPLLVKESQAARTARARTNEPPKNVVTMFHNFDAYSNVS